MNYSQEEFNQILLSKPLNEFYFAVIENRGEILTDEEYEKIIKRDDTVYTGASKEDINNLSKHFQKNEKLKKFVPDLMKTLFGLARIRHVAILTMIDDEAYDIVNIEFVDLKRNKIVQYDNFTNYYNETNARIKLFTPEEEPRLKQKTVGLDVDDASIIHTYEQAHVNQKESDDLTSSFVAEANKRNYTLSRKPNKN